MIYQDDFIIPLVYLDNIGEKNENIPIVLLSNYFTNKIIPKIYINICRV